MTMIERPYVLLAEKIRVVRERRDILVVDRIGVREGEMLGIIGPNGAGKTTLLSVLACLEKPDEGRVYYRGEEVTRKNALQVRRRLAVVFQDPLLLDGTVVENVELGLKLRGRHGEARSQAIRWLGLLGMKEKTMQSVHTLSGGESRRVSLARALAVEPEVLLLDEPFSSVDILNRRGLLKDLRRLVSGKGLTTVLVSHDFQEIRYLCTRVIVLNEGRVAAEGIPREIANHPRWAKMTWS